NPFERPERVDGSCSTSARGHALFQPRRGIRHLVVHDQALSSEAPEHIAAVEGRDKFGRFGFGERLDRAFRTVLPDDAVNAAVSLVTQVVLSHVSSARSGRGLKAR